MVGIILSGHANFASGMTSSLGLIAGEVENYAYVDFLEGMSQEELDKELNDAISKLSDCKHIVILTDLMGGTPFKRAVLLSLNHDNIKVVSGTNLPLLLQLCLSRHECTNFAEFVKHSLDEVNQSLYLFDKESI